MNSREITYTKEQMQAIRKRLLVAETERDEAVAHLRVICTLNDPPPVELALAREFLYKFDRQHIRTVWSSNAALNPPNTKDVL